MLPSAHREVTKKEEGTFPLPSTQFVTKWLLAKAVPVTSGASEKFCLSLAPSLPMRNKSSVSILMISPCRMLSLDRRSDRHYSNVLLYYYS